MSGLALLRDVVALGIASTVLAALSLAARTDVPWIPAPAPAAPAACGVDDDGAVMAVVPALRRIAVAQLSSQLDRVVVVDARPGAAFDDGHIPGAISLPAADLEALLASQSLPIPVDQDIITYCDQSSAADAEYVGRLLDDVLGCDRVHVLEGGFEAWVHAGGAVEGAQQSG